MVVLDRVIVSEVGMRRIDFPAVIAASVSAVHAREAATRGTPAAPRLPLLRLLKQGEATTLPQAAARVGSSLRHVERWWRTDRIAGRAARVRV